MSDIDAHAQRIAVEHLLRHALESGALPGEDKVTLGVEQAIKTLAWVEARPELIREIARLDREAPVLSIVLKGLPGVRIVDVREI